MPLNEFPYSIDVDGMYDRKCEGIRCIGKATLQENGKWRCLANVCGMLCVIEITITPQEMIDREHALKALKQ